MMKQAMWLGYTGKKFLGGENDKGSEESTCQAMFKE